MRLKLIWSALLLLAAQFLPAQSTAIEYAARKYVPGVTWQPKSIVTADFTCRGRAEHAILGLDPTDIVIAIFINGLNSAPEVIRDPTRSRILAKIQVESLDYDPKQILMRILRGFSARRLARASTSTTSLSIRCISTGTVSGSGSRVGRYDCCRVQMVLTWED